MKEVILALRADGITYRKIAADLGTTVGVVAGTIRDAKKVKTVVFKPEKDLPRKSIAPYIQSPPTNSKLYEELRKAVENTK